MNVVIICSDTFRYDHLGFLGQQAVVTPHLDQLARESACFTDFRLCSFPTLVNRIEVFTGRYTYPLFSWGALPYQFPVLSEVFKHHGFTTGLLADNPHLMKKRFKFGRAFDLLKPVPGQMHSKFRPNSDPMIDLPCPAEKLDPASKRLNRYRRNAYWYRQQGTNTTEALFQQAMSTLSNPPKKFFLWIDAFDPHEPWDAPGKYVDLYPSWNPDGEALFWPRSGRASAYSDADLCNMRILYKAEISQIDFWVGKLVEQLRRQKLLEETALIFCSDHGFLLGESGLIGKLFHSDVPHRARIDEYLGHLPLLIRHPQGLAAGQTVHGLCQPPDLFATALDLAGIPPVSWAQGHSLVPRLQGQNSAQQFAVSGSFPRGNPGNRQTIWSDQWCFIYSPLEGVGGSELFHRTSDPNLTRNVVGQNPAIAEQHLALLAHWLEYLKVSPARRDRLIHAKPLTRFHRTAHRVWTWKNHLGYLRRYRSYSRQTAAPDATGAGSIPPAKAANL